MSDPLISVIIPTYGREEALRDSIVDVLQQNYSNYEVLVVDQTPKHKPQVEAYLKEQEAAGKIKWYRLDWASLPGARNYAVRRSAGEIILFIDDDVSLEPEFLSAHAKNYQNPEIGAVAGRVFDRMKLEYSAEVYTQGDSNYTELEYLPPQAMD
ncbi:MAG: glycosyltransferase family 2 protein, partial [Rivularia sp. ALOHA_DT_140]|nr:glycosyltransferase family 2 protein [Rivularia sp. ALOHA_DT_140]